MPECIVCAYRQALNTTRIVTDDEATQLGVLSRVAQSLQNASLDQTPAALSQPVYAIVSEVTGVPDPYVQAKAETNRQAMALLPKLEALVRSSDDPLHAALRLAVAGNIIDLGIGHAFDLERDVAALMLQPFAVDDYPAFRAALRPGCRILYLGDNAGEIVFDRVLVELLVEAGAEVIFTVKSGPIINDATMEDARFCGLTNLVHVICTGSNDIGVNWAHVSDEFLRHYKNADLIIGKGHGNFETCTGQPGRFFFLLKAKCPVVADKLGVPLGATALRHENNL